VEIYKKLHKIAKDLNLMKLIFSLINVSTWNIKSNSSSISKEIPCQYISFSSLLALQPSMGLGLFHGFVTVDFSGVGSLAPRPTPNLEDQGLHFVWPIPFDLSGMGGPTRSYAPASIALRVMKRKKIVTFTKVGFSCSFVLFYMYST
jgi:hypothetical protein